VVTRRPAGVAHPAGPCGSLCCSGIAPGPNPPFLPPPSFRVSLVIEGGATIKSVGDSPPRSPTRLPPSVPPKALEPRPPDRALAALTASSGDLPKGAGQGGGQQGVREPPLVLSILVDLPVMAPFPPFHSHHFAALPRALPLPFLRALLCDIAAASV